MPAFQLKEKSIMSPFQNVSALSFVVLSLMLSPLSMAKGEHSNHGQVKRLAVAACAGKNNGASCQFTNKKGRNINGLCVAKRKKTVCMPEQRIKRLKACENKKQNERNERCSFTSKKGKVINGTCQQRKNKVVCRKVR